MNPYITRTDIYLSRLAESPLKMIDPCMIDLDSYFLHANYLTMAHKTNSGFF